MRAGIEAGGFSYGRVRLQIVTELRGLFCGHIGLEYQHLRNRDAALWIRERLEEYKVPDDSSGVRAPSWRSNLPFPGR
jgi:2-oxoglutarate dehydrogenase complex dehydrogenase (E1) component-like enzyme